MNLLTLLNFELEGAWSARLRPVGLKMQNLMRDWLNTVVNKASLGQSRPVMAGHGQSDPWGWWYGHSEQPWDKQIMEKCGSSHGFQSTRNRTEASSPSWKCWLRTSNLTAWFYLWWTSCLNKLTSRFGGSHCCWDAHSWWFTAKIMCFGRPNYCHPCVDAAPQDILYSKRIATVVTAVSLAVSKLL